MLESWHSCQYGKAKYMPNFDISHREGFSAYYNDFRKIEKSRQEIQMIKAIEKAIADSKFM